MSNIKQIDYQIQTRSGSPLDPRLSLNSESELDDYILYDGLTFYDKSEKMTKIVNLDEDGNVLSIVSVLDSSNFSTDDIDASIRTLNTKFNSWETTSII